MYVNVKCPYCRHELTLYSCESPSDFYKNYFKYYRNVTTLCHNCYEVFKINKETIKFTRILIQ